MDERKKNKIFLVVIILLVIIILFLLFLTRFGKIENKVLKPTGNIGIFDINIDDNCNIDCKLDDNEDIKNPDKNPTYPVWNKEKDKNELNKVFVDDKNGNLIYQKNLNIFNNAYYEYTNKIAPGTSNTYNFVVNNKSNKDINYYVELYEDSNFDINLKYRLKMNDQYVIGNDDDWVTVDELKTSFSRLNINNSDKYSLDWKWEYESDNDDKDTNVGENMDDLYKLNVRFYFEHI